MFINNNDDLLLINSKDEKDKNTLFTKYRKVIYGYYLKNLKDADIAEDLTQEVLLKLYTKMEGYDQKYPFNTWVHNIINNFMVDYIRTKRSKKGLIEQNFYDSSSQNINDSKKTETDMLINDMHYKHVLDSIHKKAKNILSQKEYEYYTLKFIEDRESKEIAEIMRTDMKKTVNMVCRVRKKLKNHLKPI